MNIKIKQVAWHRNGVGGLGFWAVLFSDFDEGDEGEDMVATVFPEAPAISCAVYSVPLLSTVGVTFGSNSWRGDNYYDELVKLVPAIKIDGT